MPLFRLLSLTIVNLCLQGSFAIPVFENSALQNPYIIASSDSEQESGHILHIKKQDYNHLEDFVLRNSGEAESEGREFFSLTHKKGGISWQGRGSKFME